MSQRYKKNRDCQTFCQNIGTIPEILPKIGKKGLSLTSSSETPMWKGIEAREGCCGTLTQGSLMGHFFQAYPSLFSIFKSLTVSANEEKKMTKRNQDCQIFFKFVTSQKSEGHSQKK